VKDKQVYTVLTKPIRRFQFVLGKLLGIVILDAGLLVLFSAIIYGITILLPTVLHADEAQMAQIRDEFFTARASVKPEAPDISQELEQAYKKLKLNGEVPAGVDENPVARHNYMNELGRRIGLRRRAAVVGEELLLEFNNVKPKDPNIFIRFKYDVAVNPPDLSIYSKWVIGDDRPFRMAANPDTPIYSLERKDVIRTFREFSVPADAVAGDGYLAVAFLNVPLNNTVVIFPFEDGLELLYKADTFTANFIRAALLIFVRLVFLSALAVFAGSFLSFPVAILLCMAVFTMANMTGYIGESFNVVGGNVSPVYTWFLQPILSLLPHFDKFDSSQFLVPARLLSWSLLAWLGFSTLCIRALLLVILSLLIFTYREIAKVIV
jgi:ABC-type transport system involved in multi-copper enzyme maturation permease subunit